MSFKKIAFASGKGGTGKTTITVNYAYYLAKSGKKVQYLDCDVEEPNGHLFLKPENTVKEKVNVLVPVVDLEKCTFCGKCGEKCRYNAIVIVKKSVLVFPEMCHSCGLCAKICPEGAIIEKERELGYTERGTGASNINFTMGVLNVSEPMATPIIEAVKKQYDNDSIGVFDAPPGTSCPVVKTIGETDAVILVTEPTPFGLHDLKIAVDVAEQMQKPMGVVINRDNGPFNQLNDYLSEKNIPVIMRFPEDRKVAETYSDGKVIIEVLPQYMNYFKAMDENIQKLIDTDRRYEADNG